MSNDLDPTRRYHGGDELSEAAFESVRGDLPRQRQIVFGAVWASMPDGLTCDEAEAVLGENHQAVSARITELKRDGWLVLHEAGAADPGTGRRRRISGLVTRPTRSGRAAGVNYVPAHVWRPGGEPPAVRGQAPAPVAERSGDAPVRLF
jgi:hypothetical protein